MQTKGDCLSFPKRQTETPLSVRRAHAMQDPDQSVPSKDMTQPDAATSEIKCQGHSKDWWSHTWDTEVQNPHSAQGFHIWWLLPTHTVFFFMKHMCSIILQSKFLKKTKWETKGHMETLAGGGYVYYLTCGDSIMGVSICPNSLYYTH